MHIPVQMCREATPCALIYEHGTSFCYHKIIFYALSSVLVIAHSNPPLWLRSVHCGRYPPSEDIHWASLSEFFRPTSVSLDVKRGLRSPLSKSGYLTGQSTPRLMYMASNLGVCLLADLLQFILNRSVSHSLGVLFTARIFWNLGSHTKDCNT